MSSCRASSRATSMLKHPTLDVRTTTAPSTFSTARRANLVVAGRWSRTGIPNNQYSPSRGQQIKYAPAMKRSSVCRDCRCQGERCGTSRRISSLCQGRIKEGLHLLVLENRRVPVTLPQVLAITRRKGGKEKEVGVEGVDILHDRICGPSFQDANGFSRVPCGYVLVCATGKRKAKIIYNFHVKYVPVYNQRGGVHQVR